MPGRTELTRVCRREGLRPGPPTSAPAVGGMPDLGGLVKVPTPHWTGSTETAEPSVAFCGGSALPNTVETSSVSLKQRNGLGAVKLHPISCSSDDNVCVTVPWTETVPGSNMSTTDRQSSKSPPTKLDASRAGTPRDDGGVGMSDGVGWATHTGEKSLNRDGEDSSGG